MDLPDDLLHLVFSFLDQINLCRAANVCTQWRAASAHEDFWRSLNFENRNISVDRFKDICGQYPNATEVKISGTPALHLLAMKAIDSLRNLEVLTLGKGRLGDTFFHALAACQRLKTLKVNDCTLGYDGVEEIPINHDRLRYLYLINCQVICVSVRCPQLETLSLKRSNMEQAILHCPLLRDLDIGSCHELCDDAIRVAAMSCPLLESLDVSNCLDISDETLGDIAPNCPNLHTLNASCCPFISLESVRLPRLTVLKLHACEGINLASMVAISQFYMLEVLELGYCRHLTSVSLDLPHLQRIRLVRCRRFADLYLRSVMLSSITVSKCPALHRINITSYALQKLELRNLESLMTLSLQCQSLQELDLTDCKSLLNSVCEVFGDGGGCPMLESLVLDNCVGLTAIRFCSTSLVSLSLVGCRAMKTLQLTCPILERMCLNGCNDLETASFCPVSLRSLNLGICAKLNKLRIKAPHMAMLELKGCGWLSEASIDCPSLSSLDASFCSLLQDDCLSTMAASCSQIESLIMTSCSSVSPDGLYSLGRLSRLIVLDLSFTFLVTLKPVFESCMQLKVLKLQACKYLTDSSLEPLYKEEALPALRELNLSYGIFSQSSMEELLSRCTHLTHVSLSGCVNMHAIIWSCHGRDRLLQNLDCVGCPNIGKVLIRPGAPCFDLLSLNLSLSSNLREVDVSCFNLCLLNLSNCCSLQVLRLDCPKLSSLLLQSCIVDEEAVEAAIAKCSMLETLDVRFCPKISSASASRMHVACSSLKRIFSSCLSYDVNKSTESRLVGREPKSFPQSLLHSVSVVLSAHTYFVSGQAMKMVLRNGSKVWIEDKELAWVAAEVIDQSGKQLRVVTASGKKVLVPPEKVFPRDADEEDHGGVDDMTKLTYLNEPGVLYNLQRRYSHNEIYTYTGNILIAVNPFTKLPHLYNIHMMEQYKGALFGELSPHVFAVSDASYRAMISDGRSQSILVSGESGAGKTETTKLIMQYLTFVGGRASGDDRTVEQQVLESNPLLEAFGNARTIRNDNSSRFGKFVEIQFDADGRISGAAIRTYLLERSRVVQITDPERNYHCFYQLCASGRDVEKYNLDQPSKFHYLNQSKTYELDGVNSADEYMKTRRAMDIVGITREDQEAIFRTLAAILHLGNIEFSPGKEHDSSTIKDTQSSFHLQMAAELFMCDVNLLISTLCTRTIQTLEGSIIKALDCNAAVASRDALAKTVYARLFDWLVDKINQSVGQDPNSSMQIGVLDIYGFECFKDNSFEQFCINFANEKLQQHFNEHVFKTEQEEYSKEEINWSYIEFIDNQDVLDLIEKKPVGIISLLDEACMFPRSTHETFTTKLFQNFRGHKRLEKTKFSETDFTVSHYAGKVTYHSDTFLEKNRDYVVVEHCNLLSSSKCTFVAGLFPLLPEESSRSSYKFSSVASRFRQQLQALMETLNSTEPHYIRCVKPNSLNLPHKFENQSILHQLRCGGVLEAVRISLAGYPTRRTYSEFLHRFGLLAPELMDGSYDEKATAEKILHKLKLSNFQLGRTKVFLRAGQIGVLDARRSEVLDNAAKCIQRRLRTYYAHKEFILIRFAAVELQAYCRGYLTRKMYTAKREATAAILIQRNVRKWLLRRAYVKIRFAASVIQSSILGFLTRQKILHGKKHKAATLIQAQWRTYKVRTAFCQDQASVVAIQCRWRQKVAKRELRRLKQEANEAGALRLAKSKLEKQIEELTWRLHLEKRLRVSNEEAKSTEISKLQKMLASLNLELDAAKLTTINECNKNEVLQNQLELSLKEKSALEREIITMAELRRENALLKNSLKALEKKNSVLELELIKYQRESVETIEKLQEVEGKCSQLQKNVKSLEGKLLLLENDNHVLRQKALSVTPKSIRPGIVKPLSEKSSSALGIPQVDQKSLYESPTPTKLIAPFSHGLAESRRSKLIIERHQENYEFLSKCIKENLGFKGGKPLAASIIYRCLLHWRAFESERTVIFDFVIEGINEALKDGDESITLPYWLSNSSALLCLLQRNLRSNGFLITTTQRTTGSASRTGQGLKSPFKIMSFGDGISHLEARYPAILFKQQLTACVEKIFGLIRDNLKKELSPLLGLCIQAPKTARMHAGKSSRSPGGLPQQPPTTQWDNIIKFLDSFMSQLRRNHVPSFFIRKLITQVFSFINISLFNSLLLRRECCTFSNGEYVKCGLAELEKWIINSKEEYAGTSWHELNYIRQAVGFLVLNQKRKKSLEEIRQDLCPALTVRQIYRISTMYWDDKYGTQSVSNEVVAEMREILNKDNQNLTSNSFLLDDDLSIPFSTEDIDMAIPAIDPSDIELPASLSESPCAHFLIRH